MYFHGTRILDCHWRSVIAELVWVANVVFDLLSLGRRYAVDELGKCPAGIRLFPSVLTLLQMGLQCHIKVILEYGLSHGVFVVTPLIELGQSFVDIDIIMFLWVGMVLRYSVVR